MFSLRVAVVRLSLLLSAWAMLTCASYAQDTYYNRDCSSCHGSAPASPKTCNGCHAHGTHASGNRTTMNLEAKVDKATYVVGDTVKVTLSGGMLSQATGWVGIRVYDKSGAEVSARKRDLHCTRISGDSTTPCDLQPLDLFITAQAGWTELYVAWAGNASDDIAHGAVKGAAATGPISAGSRALKDKDGNEIAGHAEEIVKVAFTVTAPAAASTSAAGGGALNWALLSGLFGLFFLRRKEVR